jgi:hypothetical protein
MSTSILNAPPYDPKAGRRKKLIIAGVAFAILLIGFIAYQFRNWPEERVVNRFFNALEAKNYEQAYSIWMADPNWKQHPAKYSRYKFGDFYLDWGPGGEYGLIHSYHIDGTANPKGGSGVVVVVTVNDRAEKARLWVEKSDKTMSYSPF